MTAGNNSARNYKVEILVDSNGEMSMEDMEVMATDLPTLIKAMLAAANVFTNKMQEAVDGTVEDSIAEAEVINMNQGFRERLDA